MHTRPYRQTIDHYFYAQRLRVLRFCDDSVLIENDKGFALYFPEASNRIQGHTVISEKKNIQTHTGLNISMPRDKTHPWVCDEHALNFTKALGVSKTTQKLLAFVFQNALHH